MAARTVSLGSRTGEPVTIRSRAGLVRTTPHREGWEIRAGRLAGHINEPIRLTNRTQVYRCLLGPQCDRDRCLGHQPAVEALAATILKTYKRRSIR